VIRTAVLALMAAAALAVPAAAACRHVEVAAVVADKAPGRTVGGLRLARDPLVASGR
jgi:hypothetical protein